MAGRPKRRARLIAEGKLVVGNRGDRGWNGREAVNKNRPEGMSSTNSAVEGGSTATPTALVASTPARAPEDRPNPDGRLDFVIGAKLSGQWKHRSSVAELGEKWGVSRQIVEQVSSEADRCIARIFACDDPAKVDERRGQVLADIEAEIAEARQAKRRRTIPALLKLKAGVMGVMAPIKHLVAHVNGDNPAAKLTNAELVAKVLKNDPEALEQTRALILGEGKDVVTVPAEPAEERADT